MFGNLKKNAVLGLDIGSRAIKVVKAIHRIGEKPRVDLCLHHVYDSSTGSLFQELHQFVVKNKLGGLPTAASIDDPSLKIRRVELPKMADTDLREAVRWGLRDVVEGNVTDYVVRHSTIEATIDNRHNAYVGYAIKKKVVRDFSLFLQKAGLRCQLIEPMAVTQAASLESCCPSGDNFIAAINIGASHTLMTLVGNGQFYFSRPLPQIAYKINADVDNFNARLAAEIQNTLDSFAVTFHVENIRQLMLTGVGSTIPGLAGYLSTNLGIPTSLLDPFAGFTFSEKSLAAANEHKEIYSLAASLARLPKLGIKT